MYLRSCLFVRRIDNAPFSFQPILRQIFGVRNFYARQKTKMASSVVESEQQEVQEIVVRETGPPPEDPVCDSGIYCYGKNNYLVLLFRRLHSGKRRPHLNVSIGRILSKYFSLLHP